MGDETGDETIAAGWHDDPTGRSSYRYFDGASWTEHVSSEGVTSTDPLSAPPGEPATAPLTAGVRRLLTSGAGAGVAVPGTAAVVTLSDTPEAARRRRMWGIVLLACTALIGVSLVLPWVSGTEEFSDGPPRSLTGLNYGGGTAVGFTAALLALYAWQAVAHPRVRFSIVAAGLLVISMTISFPYASTIGDGELARLGVDGTRYERSVEVPVFGEFGFRVGVGHGEVGNDERVTADIGLQLAGLAQLVAIAPVAALWWDDRRRRREAGLVF